MVINMKTYYIEGLDCANCALKIENKLNTLPGLKHATLNFATGELQVEALDETSGDLFEKINAVVQKMEPDAVLTQTKHHSHAGNHCCDSCGEICEHRHHEHGHAHNHAHENKAKKSDKEKWMPLIPIIGAVLLLVPAILINNQIISAVFFLLSGLTAGFPIFVKGIKKLVRFSFDENILLLIAFIAAFAIREYFEACLVVILFSFGEYLEDIAVAKSKRSIEALTQIRPDFANVLQNGAVVQTDCEKVQIGDHILIKPGERIPLDCIIEDGSSQIDNAAITGESIPVSAEPGSQLLSGGINLTAAVQAKVTHSFVDSTASRIIDLVKNSAAKKGNAETFISRFAAVYTPIVIIVSALLAVIPPVFGWGDFSKWLYTALIFLVAACPCAMVISVPLSFFSCIGAESKIGVLIKGGKYVEALAKMDAIAFDKTGTLTTGSLEIDRIESYHPNYTEKEILTLAAICEQYSTHPIAVSVTSSVSKEDISDKEVSEYQERRGMGISVLVNGVRYLCGAKRLLEQENIVTDSLPFANVYLADADTKQVLGGILVKDSLRPESKTSIQDLKQLGVKQAMILSGDQKTAVRNCADTLEIDYRAALLPEDKVTEVERLKKSHRKTAFVGDGINDAPVLTSADVGIAMGLGSDSAIEAADVVLVSGNLAQLPNGVRLAKKCMKIIYFNISLAIIAKLIVFILALLGMGQMWMAVIADVGVSILSVLNAARLLSVPKDFLNRKSS